jgi:transposase
MFISAPRLRSIGKADSARLQITVEGFQQMTPANAANEYAATIVGNHSSKRVGQTQGHDDHQASGAIAVRRSNRNNNQAQSRRDYEGGLDGFWVHRLLQAHGVESSVVHAASIAVDRRSRRAKTDRIDVEKLLRTLMGQTGSDEFAPS